MEADTVMSSMAATNPRWLAPEILAGNPATFTSDVYAYGVVLWELLTWDLPWGTTNPWQVRCLLCGGVIGDDGGWEAGSCAHIGEAADTPTTLQTAQEHGSGPAAAAATRHPPPHSRLLPLHSCSPFHR